MKTFKLAITLVVVLSLGTLVVACKQEPRATAGLGSAAPKAATPKTEAKAGTTPLALPSKGAATCGGYATKSACVAAKVPDQECSRCAQTSAPASNVPQCDRAAMRAATLKDGKKVLAGLKLTSSTAQADLLAGPDLYEGKTVQIEGPVLAICPGQGCWMALRGPKGKRINLKVKDGVVDFRKLAKIGVYAIGEGIFKKVGDHGVQVKITGARVGTTVCK